MSKKPINPECSNCELMSARCGLPWCNVSMAKRHFEEVLILIVAPPLTKVVNGLTWAINCTSKAVKKLRSSK